MATVNQSVIDKAKAEYKAAYDRGDKVGMEKAHAKAEAERAKAGYSGGADGSQYIKLPTSSSSGGSSSSSSKSSSSSSKSSVKTNTSYGGDFLTIDTNTDYQSKINAAVAAGDYASAAYNEALRNAKINYLDSIGQNTSGAKATNNYISVYTQSKGSGGAGTNNQGGTAYTNNINSIGSLNSNWTTANINGALYTRDSNGNIYQNVGTFQNGSANNQLVGNGYNADTNEFTFNNTEDARKAAYDKYIGSGAFSDAGYVGDGDVYRYIENKGLVDGGFVNAMQSGTVGQYNQANYRAAEAELKRLAALKAAQEEKQYNSGNANVESTGGPYTSSPSVDPNSFESSLNNGSGLDNDEYMQNIINRINKGLSNRY